MAHVFISRCHSEQMQGARISQTNQSEWVLAPAINTGIGEIIKGSKHRVYQLNKSWNERIDTINTFYDLSPEKNNVYAIEVHFNASTNMHRHGYFAMAWHTSVEGQALSRAILMEIAKTNTTAKNLGINLTDGKKMWLGGPWEYESHRGSFVRVTRCPAVLIECGFLTSPIDNAYFRNETNRIDFGWIIGNGIVKYLDRKELT